MSYPEINMEFNNREISSTVESIEAVPDNTWNMFSSLRMYPICPFMYL